MAPYDLGSALPSLVLSHRLPLATATIEVSGSPVGADISIILATQKAETGGFKFEVSLDNLPRPHLGNKLLARDLTQQPDASLASTVF